MGDSVKIADSQTNCLNIVELPLSANSFILRGNDMSTLKRTFVSMH